MTTKTDSRLASGQGAQRVVQASAPFSLEAGETDSGFKGEGWGHRPLPDVSKRKGSLGEVSWAWQRGWEEFLN